MLLSLAPLNRCILPPMTGIALEAALFLSLTRAVPRFRRLIFYHVAWPSPPSMSGSLVRASPELKSRT